MIQGHRTLLSKKATCVLEPPSGGHFEEMEGAFVRRCPLHKNRLLKKSTTEAILIQAVPMEQESLPFEGAGRSAWREILNLNRHAVLS